MGELSIPGNVSPVAEYPDAQCRDSLCIFHNRSSRFTYHITKSGMDENWEIRYKMLSPMHDILTIAYLIDEKVFL
ncbi:hypothetical protein ADH70_008220 [Blautia pseudococcoides]|uniref:Uncharacterized protein n=1 Tax=Blautia pseudococcoides TaxID=1796616 RepID=A0A1C7I8N7_9FIRM|nr:hypothetical protein A4V09_09775 [Blautia pseudococcoides]ASU28835.1 hypothetical protein ADH70_008220 [Blautia pseudococcoides]